MIRKKNYTMKHYYAPIILILFIIIAHNENIGIKKICDSTEINGNTERAQ